MASDVGRHALAQQYYTQALNMAMAAGSRRYAANVLSHMSRLTLQVGQRATQRDEAVLHARHSVALARTGLALGGSDLSAAQLALLHAMEARGLAVSGDPQAAREAIRAAESDYARSRPGDEPTWLAFYTPAELEADLGRALGDVGEHAQAARALANALRSYESWRVRSRCFVTTDLASVYLRAGDHDGVSAAARQALTAASPIASTRTTERLGALQRQLSPHVAQSRALRTLDEELTDFLTHSAVDARN
jgi:tetratricopeptide (TPR) repeat protein